MGNLITTGNLVFKKVLNETYLITSIKYLLETSKDWNSVFLETVCWIAQFLLDFNDLPFTDLEVLFKIGCLGVRSRDN